MADTVLLSNDNHHAVVQSSLQSPYDPSGNPSENDDRRETHPVPPRSGDPGSSVVSNGHAYLVGAGLNINAMIVEPHGQADAAPCEVFNPDSLPKEPNTPTQAATSPRRQIPPPLTLKEHTGGTSPSSSPQRRSPSPRKGTPTKIPSLTQRPRSVGSYDDAVRPRSPKRSTLPRPSSCVLKSSTLREESRREVYSAGGSNTRNFDDKLDMSGVKPRTNSHSTHKPGGGNVKIFDQKLDFSHVKSKSDVGSRSPRKSAEPTSPRVKNVLSPLPNTKAIQSKIGSKDNIKHTPGGGKVKIQTEKVDFSTVQSRCGSMDNTKHKAGGGNVKILDAKVDFSSKVQSKVGSLDNAGHTPVGGNVKIETKKLDFSKTSSKVGSRDNIKHQPLGGNKKIINEKVEFKADSKVGSKDNMKHQAGGGAVKIVNEKVDFSSKASARIGSKDNMDHKPGGGAVQIIDEKMSFKEVISPRTDSGVREPISPGGSLSRTPRRSRSRSSGGSQEDNRK